MTRIQLQIMSDLHLEVPKSTPLYGEYEIQPQCSCLALLGDIGNVSDVRLFEFLEKMLLQFETVLYLLGNHELYGITLSEARAKVRSFEAKIEHQRKGCIGPTGGKFIFLERPRYDMSDTVTVLGCTLFSSIPHSQRDSVARIVSDFSRISDWSVYSHDVAHQIDLQWLNSEVASCIQHEPHRSIVVLTHHSPTALEEADDPKHVRDDMQIRSAFTTDLSDQICWKNPKVKLWAFGHTHFNFDIVDPLTGKRIVANQKGYSKEGPFDFSNTKVVDVDVRLLPETKHVKARKDDVRESKRCTIL